MVKNTNKSISCLLMLCFFAADSGIAQTITLPPDGGNQKASVSQWMGLVEVGFTYNSPDVTSQGGEDRTGMIWGELVPWGLTDLGFGTTTESPWRAGANENTVFYASHDVMGEGKELKAGHYGFHIITVGNGPWTPIFSSDYNSWGSFFYDPANDVLRVEVNPEKCEFTEWLTYGFDDRQLSTCTAWLRWENLEVPFSIEVPDINSLYLAKIRGELYNMPGFHHMAWVSAARFCAQNTINLEKALEWADYALTAPWVGEENFQTLQTRALVLYAMDKTDEADRDMDKAIEQPSATVTAVHTFGRSLISQGRNEKALEVFQKNAKLHPEEKFTTTVGLARGFTAVGDTKRAIKYWEEAIDNLPENQKAYLSYYQEELNKLKE